MGGVGSGNWYRFDKKTTIEECHSVDIRYLCKNGSLKPGCRFSLRWSRAGRETGAISGMVYSDRLILVYRHRPRGGDWEDVVEPIELTYTPCNFGGERPWFVCPGVACGRRVAVLYGPGKYFLCRHCYDLRYESQRGDKKDRALRRAQKIRQRLGGSANMLEPFPDRPKGMHHHTYRRLRWEHCEAEMEQFAGMRAWLDRREKRLS